MKLSPIRTNIIFQFAEEISGRVFSRNTSWGFQLRQQTEEIKQPRWRKVLQVGPEVSSNIKENEYVLILPLMWTERISEDGEPNIWITNESKIIATSKTLPNGIGF